MTLKMILKLINYYFLIFIFVGVFTKYKKYIY